MRDWVTPAAALALIAGWLTYEEISRRRSRRRTTRRTHP